MECNISIRSLIGIALLSGLQRVQMEFHEFMEKKYYKVEGKSLKFPRKSRSKVVFN